ncbi:hypothetical protein ACLOJK_040800 [Asimina triloba]
MLPPYNILITGSTKGPSLLKCSFPLVAFHTHLEWANACTEASLFPPSQSTHPTSNFLEYAGIGYALAKEFLKAGDRIVICSRSAERVESAVQSLREEFGELHGTVCDVRDGNAVKALVAFAHEKLQYIDIWFVTYYFTVLRELEQINNAGSNAYSYKPLAEASDEDLMEVVTTNTLGLMICCREVNVLSRYFSLAIKMMSNQPRGGHIFNIDGAGSDGRPTPRSGRVPTGQNVENHFLTGKCSKVYQSISAAELQMQEVANVMVHNLSDHFVLDTIELSLRNRRELHILKGARSYETGLIRAAATLYCVAANVRGGLIFYEERACKSYLDRRVEKQSSSNSGFAAIALGSAFGLDACLLVHNSITIMLAHPTLTVPWRSLKLLSSHVSGVSVYLPGMVTTELLMSGATTKQVVSFSVLLSKSGGFY